MQIDQVQESKVSLDALKEAQSRLVPYIGIVQFCPKH